MEKIVTESNDESETNNEKFRYLTNPAERLMIEFGITELIKQCQRQEYDTLIFLDKSARPFSWLLQEVWPQITRAPLPAIKFVNPPAVVTDETKNRFSETFQGYLGHNICLVDETSSTGRSFNVVRELITTVVPEGSIDQFEVMTIWPRWKRQSGELTGVRAATDNSSFLSQPNSTPDSKDLRKEIATLGSNLLTHHNDISLAQDSAATDIIPLDQLSTVLSAVLDLHPTEANNHLMDWLIVDDAELMANIHRDQYSLSHLWWIFTLLRKSTVRLRSDPTPYGYQELENDTLIALAAAIEAKSNNY
ncbi:MAG: hypothetical protein Q7S64_01430 [bacterium]|nr:hypothetical protein [bacterium]